MGPLLGLRSLHWRLGLSNSEVRRHKLHASPTLFASYLSVWSGGFYRIPSGSSCSKLVKIRMNVGKRPLINSAASAILGSLSPLAASQHNAGSAQIASSRTALSGHWPATATLRCSFPEAVIDRLRCILAEPMTATRDEVAFRPLSCKVRFGAAIWPRCGYANMLIQRLIK